MTGWSNGKRGRRVSIDFTMSSGFSGRRAQNSCRMDQVPGKFDDRIRLPGVRDAMCSQPRGGLGVVYRLREEDSNTLREYLPEDYAHCRRGENLSQFLRRSRATSTTLRAGVRHRSCGSPTSGTAFPGQEQRTSPFSFGTLGQCGGNDCRQSSWVRHASREAVVSGQRTSDVPFRHRLFCGND